jgi:hypothetical protein
MINVKTGSKIDIKKIERCIKRDTILVGYPFGRAHSSGIEMATLAEWLTFGTEDISPGWNFLEDGILSKKNELQKMIKESFTNLILEGKSQNKKIGASAVGAVQEFVRGDDYRSSHPNKPSTLKRKLKKGKDHPIIVDGDMINATTFVIKEK